MTTVPSDVTSQPMLDYTATESKLLLKPTWLKQQDFAELLRQNGGQPRCARTGATDNLTVDHIVPRWAGGTDDISNLQFLVDRENIKKSIHPDEHWSRSFYWDKTPNLAGFREAQRQLFSTIARSPWFGRPISQVSRRLYLNAWVVAAGKTLGMASAAWAVNHVIRENWGASPRAACLLIATKEQAVRDQIAASLREDIVRYGIAADAPRVGVIRSSSQFEQTGWIDQLDVAVTTVQMLWERKDGIPRDKVSQILARFPVIAFDEPHFAADQVSGIVEQASSSLCFGFTGTPVDADGRLLQQMTTLTIYGYSDASENDHSLKYLDSEPAHFRKFVNEIGIVDAQLIEHGEQRPTDDPTEKGYDKNIEPAKSVVRAVIDEMKKRDQLIVDAEGLAPHRDRDEFDLGMIYPAHGLIVCDNIPAADALCKNTNALFARDPFNYPEAEGWSAQVVHTETFDGRGERLAGRPLTDDHPWLRSKSLGFRVDAKCSRLLFVVGIGREGVDNPACGPVGIATSQHSIVEVVQRAVGRQLRAVRQSSGDGKLLAPPEPLDSVLIITHASFGNTRIIERAIDFVCHMDDHLDGLPTLADIENGDPATPEEIKGGIALMVREKIDIAGRCSEMSPDGAVVPLDVVVSEYAGFDTSARVERIREWAEKVRHDPSAARRDLHLGKGISPALIVTRERVRHDPDDVEIERHIKIHHQDLIGYLPITSDERRNLMKALHAKHADQFHLPPLTSDTDIETIRRAMAGRVRRDLGATYKDGGDSQRIYKLTGAAVKMKLDVPDGERARKESDWDIPQVHALLLRPDVQAEICGWVRGRLIDDGHCPALSLLRDDGQR